MSECSFLAPTTSLKKLSSGKLVYELLGNLTTKRGRRAVREGGGFGWDSVTLPEPPSTACGSPRPTLCFQVSDTSKIWVLGVLQGQGLSPGTTPLPRGGRTHPRDGEGSTEVPAAHQAEAPG